jgi:hypothetical protein
MTLHPDLYPSNIRISDITETLDDYYTALYYSLNNPQKPSELYTKNKSTSVDDVYQFATLRSQKR